MPKKNLISYSNPSKVFHWVVALLVLLMLALSFFMEDIQEQYQPQAYFIHKSIGLLIFLLMIIRILWIFYRGKPPLPKTVPTWQKWVARIVQYSLYLFLILMPISGLVMSVAADHPPSFFGLFTVTLPIAPNEALAEFMAEVHEFIAWTLITLIVLHVGGALKHFLIDKDNVLQTMLPGGNKK
ncbi:cybB cytochrome b-561 transmembrane protein (plasmid) [Legionella adelaidensis]|uniref:Cytochrome b-561 transmembrane protein n=1 Tax=Legionella adelaidensis TaxID=45056 RepID=A0A0W0R215_9GAMM|nr:cytochrome b [Legionella adelaidensis]KTC65096.1 cytochrome b-561 transmembrane protein [Legionella adelaidensis]VEH85384.1 cybB cytochrome b-561 transmembrane protein [Legionella adelaidensis]